MTRARMEKLRRSYDIGEGYRLNFEFDPATDEITYDWTPAVSVEKVEFDLDGGRTCGMLFAILKDDAACDFAERVATWLGEPIGMLNPLLSESVPVRAMLPNGFEAEAIRTFELPHGFKATFRIGSNASKLEPTVSWTPHEPESLKRGRDNGLTRAYAQARAEFLRGVGTDLCPWRGCVPIEAGASRAPGEGSDTNGAQ